MPSMQETDGKLIVAVYVQPKASRTRLAGFHDDVLKVSVAAQPVDGKANAALAVFFAKLFGIPKSAVTVESGHRGRRKRLAITGISSSAFRAIIGPDGCGHQPPQKD